MNQGLAIRSEMQHRVASSLWRNHCQLPRVEAFFLFFFFRFPRHTYQILGLIPLAHKVLHTKYVACQYGPDGNLLVVKSAQEVVNCPVFLDCPSDHSAVAGKYWARSMSAE